MGLGRVLPRAHSLGPLLGEGECSAVSPPGSGHGGGWGGGVDFVLSNPCRGRGARLTVGALAPGHPSQLAHPYRTMILRAMETVVSSHIGKLDKDRARAVILLASSEMTKAKVRSRGQPPRVRTWACACCPGWALRPAH